MGDCGFFGAGEFGGQGIPHGCLPDRHFTKCLGRERGLENDVLNDKTVLCKYSGRPDADGKGFGYDACNFLGDDFNDCLRLPRDLETKTE